MSTNVNNPIVEFTDHLKDFVNIDASEAIKQTNKRNEDKKLEALKKRRHEQLLENSSQLYITRTGFLRKRVLHATKGWQHHRVADYSEAFNKITNEKNFKLAVKHLEKTIGKKIHTDIARG